MFFLEAGEKDPFEDRDVWPQRAAPLSGTTAAKPAEQEARNKQTLKLAPENVYSGTWSKLRSAGRHRMRVCVAGWGHIQITKPGGAHALLSLISTTAI